MTAQAVGTSGGKAHIGGYWRDPHGHIVFNCEGTILPGCPRMPFLTTYWRLQRETGCVHASQESELKAA